MASIFDLVQAGVGIYSAYQSAKAAREQADAARKAARASSKQASTAKSQGLEQLQILRDTAAAQRLQFEQNLQQTREQTAALASQAQQSRAAAEQQVIQQKQSSALALQQQRLAAEMQQQQQMTTGPVSSRVRKRVGTPAALRTNLEIRSPLSVGIGMGTPNATGGLNV
jgi:hypothetical protein